MGRDRRADKIADASADPADSGKKISLKVSERSGQTVHKIAAHRGVSVASHLVAAGVPLADVARFLGDTVASIVATYLHAVGTDPAAAIESMFGDDAK